MSGGRHPRIGIPWSGGGGGDPEFRALGTTYDSGATLVTSTASTLSGVSIGDLLLFFAQRDAQSDITGVTGGGNTLSRIASIDPTIASGFLYDVWAGIAVAASASLVLTANYSSSNAWATCSSARYSGVASATPIAASVTPTELNIISTIMTAPAITPAQNCIVLSVGTGWNIKSTHTAANGFTKRMDASNTSPQTIQFLLDRVVPAGTQVGGASNFSTIPAEDQYLATLLAFV